MFVFIRKAFDGGFVIDQKNADLVVFQGGLGMDHNEIAVVDSGLDHAVTLYLEGEHTVGVKD